MGHRGHIAIVRDGVRRHYGGKVMGLDLWCELVLGPDVALAWTAAHPVWPSDEWYDEEVIEGAALIDVDHERLVFFCSFGINPSTPGGEDEYGLRRVVLDTFHTTWPGWTIEWAYDGFGDITDALGIDRAVLRRPSRVARPITLSHEGWPWFAVSTRMEDGRVRAYSFGTESHEPLRAGPTLLDQLEEHRSTTNFAQIPHQGLHLDIQSRQVGLWHIDRLHGLADDFPHMWPGWSLEHWQDRYTEQIRQCDGALEFPPSDLPTQRERLIAHVVSGWHAFTVEHAEETLAWQQRGGWEPSAAAIGSANAKLTMARLEDFAHLVRNLS